MLNDTETARLAALGTALRPDWPATSLRTFIERNLATRAYSDLALALTWIATRTKTETPRLLLEPGAWWTVTRDPAATSGHPHPPKTAEACNVCGRHQRACVCDLPTADDTPPQPHTWNQANPHHRAAVIADLRAQLRAAQPDTEETL